jgi:hypothetical protein
MDATTRVPPGGLPEATTRVPPGGLPEATTRVPPGGLPLSPRLRALVRHAESQAIRGGHRLDVWMHGDSRREVMTLCLECGLFAVASTIPGDTPLCGSTLSVRCDGVGTEPAWLDARIA